MTSSQRIFVSVSASVSTLFEVHKFVVHKLVNFIACLRFLKRLKFRCHVVSIY